jgi:hypothetical protein
MQFQASPGKIERPYLKNIQHKTRADRVAQVVEHLPSKNEGLSSNPSTTVKKKKKISWHCFFKVTARG